jgi:hypothetical protein
MNRMWENVILNEVKDPSSINGLLKVENGKKKIQQQSSQGRHKEYKDDFPNPARIELV